MKLPGIAYALTRSDLLAGRVARGSHPKHDSAQLSSHPFRAYSCGAETILDASFNGGSREDGRSQNMAAIHGSPWTYDTYVPILFAGQGISHQTVARLVGPEDIAPTLAAYLGIKPPSGSIGQPLTEVLAQMSERN